MTLRFSTELIVLIRVEMGDLLSWGFLTIMSWLCRLDWTGNKNDVDLFQHLWLASKLKEFRWPKYFSVLIMTTESTYKNIIMRTFGFRRRASACVIFGMVAFEKLSSYWWSKLVFQSQGKVTWLIYFFAFFRPSSSKRWLPRAGVKFHWCDEEWVEKRVHLPHSLDREG